MELSIHTRFKLELLRQFIKELAEEQKVLKPKRKTGRYEPLVNKWGYVSREDIPKHVLEAFKAAGDVRRNKLRITAAHILQHELRGDTERYHTMKVSKECECNYWLFTLRKQLEDVKVKLDR